MKESDYIHATNLAKAEAAERLLVDTLLPDEDVDCEALRKIAIDTTQRFVRALRRDIKID